MEKLERLHLARGCARNLGAYVVGQGPVSVIKIAIVDTALARVKRVCCHIQTAAGHHIFLAELLEQQGGELVIGWAHLRHVVWLDRLCIMLRGPVVQEGIIVP
eukprot:scaffold1397_cov254-Pinguiococcus_pyrenoidosus.AAC.9